MADEAPKAEAPKAPAHSKPDENPQWSKDKDGNLVFNGEYPDVARIKAEREVISKELRESDKYDSDGLGDNASGDASEKASDHFFSHDPAKRAFPPGSDDVTLL